MKEMYATCTLGLEQVLAQELTDLGVKELQLGRGGVRFRADQKLRYRAALWLRSATRLQELMAEDTVRSDADLYQWLHAMPWEERVRSDQTISVSASVRDSAMTHSQYAALKSKDAIVDRLRDKTGRRPSVDRKEADLPLKVVLQQNHARLYRDLGGASLHKRGYRPIQVKSPLNEAIAAGLLLLTKWDGTTPLIDPLCGSGTFLIEAAWIALDRAPGLGRRFAFEKWPDHDGGLWRDLVKEAKQRVKASVPVRLQGADHHPGALAIAKRSATVAGVKDAISFTESSVDRLHPIVSPDVIITNPPWGRRLGNPGDLARTWANLGDFLRKHGGGATAYILSGDSEPTRHLRLRASAKLPLMIGQVDCRFLRYELYDGPRMDTERA